MEEYLKSALEIVKAQASVRIMTDEEITAMVRRLAIGIRDASLESGEGAVEEAVSLDPKKAVKEKTITCLECGKSFKVITKKHLASHGLTPEEYKAKHGYKKSMRAELAEIRGLFTGKLRLGLPIFGSARLFAPLFAAYRRRYPGVEIELLEQGSSRLEEGILAGELELGVSLLPVSDVFASQPVCDDPLMALLWAEHPLSDRERLHLAALAPSPFILFEHGFALNPRIETACLARGFSPQVSARSSQMDFIVALVASGMGVALVPRIMTEERSLAPVRAVLVDEVDLRWRAALVWRRGAHLSPAARAWLELTREAFGPSGKGRA